MRHGHLNSPKHGLGCFGGICSCSVGKDQGAHACHMAQPLLETVCWKRRGLTLRVSSLVRLGFLGILGQVIEILEARHMFISSTFTAIYCNYIVHEVGLPAVFLFSIYFHCCNGDLMPKVLVL